MTQMMERPAGESPVVLSGEEILSKIEVFNAVRGIFTDDERTQDVAYLTRAGKETGVLAGYADGISVVVLAPTTDGGTNTEVQIGSGSYLFPLGAQKEWDSLDEAVFGTGPEGYRVTIQEAEFVTGVLGKLETSRFSSRTAAIMAQLAAGESPFTTKNAFVGDKPTGRSYKSWKNVY